MYGTQVLWADFLWHHHFSGMACRLLFEGVTRGLLPWTGSMLCVLNVCFQLHQMLLDKFWRCTLHCEALQKNPPFPWSPPQWLRVAHRYCTVQRLCGRPCPLWPPGCPGASALCSHPSMEQPDVREGTENQAVFGTFLGPCLI